MCSAKVFPFSSFYETSTIKPCISAQVWLVRIASLTTTEHSSSNRQNKSFKYWQIFLFLRSHFTYKYESKVNLIRLNFSISINSFADFPSVEIGQNASSFSIQDSLRIPGKFNVIGKTLQSPLCPQNPPKFLLIKPLVRLAYRETIYHPLQFPFHFT